MVIKSKLQLESPISSAVAKAGEDKDKDNGEKTCFVVVYQ